MNVPLNTPELVGYFLCTACVDIWNLNLVGYRSMSAVEMLFLGQLYTRFSRTLFEKHNWETLIIGEFVFHVIISLFGFTGCSFFFVAGPPQISVFNQENDYVVLQMFEGYGEFPKLRVKASTLRARQKQRVDKDS